MDKILKNKKILLVIAFICAIGVFGGTYAYFTGRNVAKNGFTAGVYSSYVEKQFTSPENWQPGDVTPFVVNVTNEGNVDMAVRAKITEEWISADGVTSLSGERNDERLALYEIANEEWLYTMDRYYYYTEPLLPGETTLNLIESVTFNPNFYFEEGLDFECTNTTDDAGNITQSCEGISTGYSGATFKLTVTVETIQLDHRWAYATFSDDLYEQIAWQGMTDENINFSSNKVETGVYTVSSTLNDTYPIHYYRGNVTNNHIIFAGFCWEIVRTTETGGVKLLYDGIPTDKGYCTNIGYDSMTSDRVQYNDRNVCYDDGNGGTTCTYNGRSLDLVGYMYNLTYKPDDISMGHGRSILDSRWMDRNSDYNSYYYFADSVTYDSEKNLYTLNNPQMYTWDERSSMEGKYTCYSQNSDYSCYWIYYVVGSKESEYSSSSGDVYSLSYSSGSDIDELNYDINVAASIVKNDDGSYSLENPITIKRMDWLKYYDQYENYYICYDNFQSTTCGLDELFVMTDTNAGGYQGLYYKYTLYLYGNSFKYENGSYQLVDTVKRENFDYEDTTLDNYHYTCLNSSGKCKKIKYIYYASGSYFYYITLSGGESVEDAINNMLHSEDVNKTNSEIKTYIEDTWYKNNMLKYTSYLENTIYCNDRSVYDLGGWNPDGGSLNQSITFINEKSKPRLSCNKNDQFTLSVDNGGTNGYGNNMLKYPVGLLTGDEAIMAGQEDSYLENNRESWHTMTPFRAYSSSPDLVGPVWDTVCLECSYRVRPVVTLKPGLKISAGVGTETEPYVIKTK